MKFLMLVISLLFCTTLFSQQLKITPEVFDFGEIKEEGGKRVATFVLENISSKPYIMTYSYSGCGCVSSDVSKKPILPGVKREVKVEFDPMRRPGEINKSVVLVSDGNRRKDQLRLAGTVIPRIKSIEELYPVEALEGVFMSDDKFPMGLIMEGEPSAGVLNLFNTSGRDVSVKAELISAKSFGSVELSHSVMKPNTSAQMMFTYDLTGTKFYGELSDSINLIINGRKLASPIAVSALSIYNFFNMTDLERENTPRATVSPREYAVTLGVPVSVKVSNTGLSELKVLAVMQRGDISYSLNSRSAKQDGELSLSLTLNSGEEASVSLLCNSSDTPVVTLNLVKAE